MVLCGVLTKYRTTKGDLNEPLKIEIVETQKAPLKRKESRIVQTEHGEKTEKSSADAFLGFQNQTFERQTISRKSTGGKQQLAPDRSLAHLGLPLMRSEDEWRSELDSPQDYIKGMKESDHTALNTREFVFYGYFQRIRRRLDQAWVPLLRKNLVRYYQSGKHLAKDMDHTTRLIVTLNSKGEIIRVEMVGESGTEGLDDAAVAAFNEAGPFPNPPRGMIDKNSEVKIPWDFVLKT